MSAFEIECIKTLSAARFIGHVKKVSTNYIISDGPQCRVGDLCDIEIGGSSCSVPAEVTQVDKDGCVLMPLDGGSLASPDDKIVLRQSGGGVVVGNGFAGRMVGGLGEAIDHGSSIMATHVHIADHYILQPMERVEANELVATGIKAIDAFLTLARGQRMGVFAASGVGKTSLMRRLATQVECDRCVVCLVGERGREVEEIWSTFKQRDDAERFTCVSATSDKSPVIRARAVNQALAIAEYWRDQGEHVLLLIDSITRYAMALREIGLAAGAPPTLRAYTPNVFDLLPKVVERCGASQNGGAITAVMTVLSENDDVDDPIAEVMKSLLDGHIVLSRELAEQGHFPAIDISRSISRCADNIISDEQRRDAKEFVSLMKAYKDARILVESGVYQEGSDDHIDAAIAKKDLMSRFLQQAEAYVPFEATVVELQNIARGGA